MDTLKKKSEIKNERVIIYMVRYREFARNPSFIGAMWMEQNRSCVVWDVAVATCM